MLLFYNMLINPDGTVCSVFDGETSKAHERRLKEGCYKKYAHSDRIGLDIGCGEDPLNKTFRRYDQIFNDGDAALLPDMPENTYWTVYASHVLEHMQYPKQAIKRWYQVVHPLGHLIIIVPHRDLYEKKKMLPSQWNPDHKYFWLPDTEEPPCTKSLKNEVLSAIPDADIVNFRVVSDGYIDAGGEFGHPGGEYSIEIIVKKGLSVLN